MNVDLMMMGMLAVLIWCVLVLVCFLVLCFMDLSENLGEYLEEDDK